MPELNVVGNAQVQRDSDIETFSDEHQVFFQLTIASCSNADPAKRSRTRPVFPPTPAGRSLFGVEVAIVSYER
jgi:hypothetical protein